MIFGFEGASASAPIEATGSLSKIGFHTVPPSVVFHTPRHPPQNNRPPDFPARPPRRSPFRREMAQSSAISSPKTPKRKSPGQGIDQSHTIQAECRRQREGHDFFRETFSSETPLNAGNSAIGQHLNSRNG